MNQKTIKHIAFALDCIEDDLIKATVEVRKLRYLLEEEIKDDEIDEFCDVSGAKLGKECQHEDDGVEHRFHDDGGRFAMRSCSKCGDFYK